MSWLRWVLCAALGIAWVKLPAEDLSGRIVFLISPPRSMSAACARMMQARGDFEVFHEPFHLPYVCEFHPHYAPYVFEPGLHATYQEVKQMLFDAAETKGVFVKEMSFDLREYLLNDLEFVRDKRVSFVFLMRDPHSSVISFYRKSQFCPSMLNYLIGYEPLYHIFETVKKESPNRILLLSAEQLAEDPEEIIEKLCQDLDIPFLLHALHWASGKEGFDVHKEWHEMKKDQAVEQWHQDALESTGFKPLSRYAKDSAGNPTFEEIADPEHREKYQEAYFYNLQFYEMIRNDPLFQLPQENH
jgi:hypothetical protein